MHIIVLLLSFFAANAAYSATSPCYWQAQIVRCLPQNGIFLDGQKELRLGEATANGVNYVALKGPSAITTDYTLTFPAAVGAADDVITTNASGVLSFGKVANVNVSSSAAIAYSKLNLSNSIVNADINASAGIVDTKLATISTAGKVSGSAITSGTIGGTTSISTSGTLTTSTTATAATNVVGTGDASASPFFGTLRGSSGAGTNIAGAPLVVTAGNGTGTGGSGSILFQTAPAGSTGAAANTMATRLTISNSGASTFAGSLTVPAFTVQSLSGNADFVVRSQDGLGSWDIASSQGSGLFAIYDINSNTTPFTIRKAAPDYSLYITATGNVGIGTLTAGAKLTVAGAGTFTGNVGIGTTSTTSSVSFGGATARTIQQERHTTADTAGSALTMAAGGATSAATNKNGGDLTLSSGIATGTGSSSILLQTATAGGSGTTDRTPTTKVTIAGSGDTTFTGQILAASGSVTEPSVSFSADDDTSGTGLYRIGANNLGFASNGTAIGNISSGGAWTIGASGSTQAHTVNGRQLLNTSGENSGQIYTTTSFNVTGSGGTSSFTPSGGGGLALALNANSGELGLFLFSSTGEVLVTGAGWAAGTGAGTNNKLDYNGTTITITNNNGSTNTYSVFQIGMAP